MDHTDVPLVATQKVQNKPFTIYKAVMEAIKACENIDINSGNDINNGGHSHVDPVELNVESSR